MLESWMRALFNMFRADQHKMLTQDRQNRQQLKANYYVIEILLKVNWSSRKLIFGYRNVSMFVYLFIDISFQSELNENLSVNVSALKSNPYTSQYIFVLIENGKLSCVFISDEHQNHYFLLIFQTLKSYHWWLFLAKPHFRWYVCVCVCGHTVV